MNERDGGGEELKIWGEEMYIQYGTAIYTKPMKTAMSPFQA